MTSTPTRPIVVAVDGSRSSVIALRKAAELAISLQAGLELITCWRMPQFYSEYIAMHPDAFREDAQQMQDTAVAEAFPDGCPVPMRAALRQGRAATELIDSSRDAQMLVMGTRGHGGFVNLVIGSVSLECIAQAHCPVLVTRAATDEG